MWWLCRRYGRSGWLSGSSAPCGCKLVTVRTYALPASCRDRRCVVEIVVASCSWPHDFRGNLDANDDVSRPWGFCSPGPRRPPRSKSRWTTRPRWPAPRKPHAEPERATSMEQQQAHPPTPSRPEVYAHSVTRMRRMVAIRVQSRATTGSEVALRAPDRLGRRPMPLHEFSKTGS
jgi:hypothetical protein